MAIKQGTVTVTTTATVLNTFPDSDNVWGNSLLVQNNDASVTIYVGGPTVTTSGATQGVLLVAGAAIPFDFVSGDALYGIAGSTVTVNVLATGV